MWDLYGTISYNLKSFRPFSFFYLSIYFKLNAGNFVVENIMLRHFTNVRAFIYRSVLHGSLNNDKILSF